MPSFFLALALLLLMVSGVFAQSLDFRLEESNSAPTLKWSGQSGTTYFVQHSSTLGSWEFAPRLYTGANAPLFHRVEPVTKTAFFRLLYTDQETGGNANEADFDRDGLSNILELTSTPQTSPLKADTDGDGIPDGEEGPSGVGVPVTGGGSGGGSSGGGGTGGSGDGDSGGGSSGGGGTGDAAEAQVVEVLSQWWSYGISMYDYDVTEGLSVSKGGSHDRNDIGAGDGTTTEYDTYTDMDGYYYTDFGMGPGVEGGGSLSATHPTFTFEDTKEAWVSPSYMTLSEYTPYYEEYYESGPFLLRFGYSNQTGLMRLKAFTQNVEAGTTVTKSYVVFRKVYDSSGEGPSIEPATYKPSKEQEGVSASLEGYVLKVDFKVGANGESQPFEIKHDDFTQVKDSRVLFLPVEVVPDDGEIGITGDVIESNNGSTGEMHYVTPKKGNEIPKDYVVFKAKGFTDELFEKAIEWEGGESVTNEPQKGK